jgi:hypothetical protein
VLRKEAVIALWSRTKVILDAYAAQWVADNVATRLAAADQATLNSHLQAGSSARSQLTTTCLSTQRGCCQSGLPKRPSCVFRTTA